MTITAETRYIQNNLPVNNDPLYILNELFIEIPVGDTLQTYYYDMALLPLALIFYQHGGKKYLLQYFYPSSQFRFAGDTIVSNLPSDADSQAEIGVINITGAKAAHVKSIDLACEANEMIYICEAAERKIWASPAPINQQLNDIIQDIIRR